jgi:hypothetical protein
VLIFHALEALTRENPSMTDPGAVRRQRESATKKKGAKHG